MFLCIFRVAVCLTRMVSRCLSSDFLFPLAPPPLFGLFLRVYTKTLVPNWIPREHHVKNSLTRAFFRVSQTTWGSRDGADDYDAERMKKRTDNDRPKSPYYPKFITQWLRKWMIVGASVPRYNLVQLITIVCVLQASPDERGIPSITWWGHPTKDPNKVVATVPKSLSFI